LAPILAPRFNRYRRSNTRQEKAVNTMNTLMDRIRARRAAQRRAAAIHAALTASHNSRAMREELLAMASRFE
jgi:type II secretory pathway pseudopilin PulG